MTEPTPAVLTAKELAEVARIRELHRTAQWPSFTNYSHEQVGLLLKALGIVVAQRDAARADAARLQEALRSIWLVGPRNAIETERVPARVIDPEEALRVIHAWAGRVLEEAHAGVWFLNLAYAAKTYLTAVTTKVSFHDEFDSLADAVKRLEP